MANNKAMSKQAELQAKLKVVNVQEIARLSGVSTKTIYRIREQGADAPSPLHDTVSKIEAALVIYPVILERKKARKRSARRRDVSLKTKGNS